MCNSPVHYSTSTTSKRSKVISAVSYTHLGRLTLKESEMEAEARRILGDLKIDLDPRQTVGDLPVSKQQIDVYKRQAKGRVFFHSQHKPCRFSLPQQCS